MLYIVLYTANNHIALKSIHIHLAAAGVACKYSLITLHTLSIANSSYVLSYVSNTGRTTRSRMVLEILKLAALLESYSKVSTGQVNANGL